MKFLENVRKRLRLELINKDDIKNIFKQQSKLTLNGIHISYENYDSYTFKQNQVVMDKAIYVGFAVSELSKLHLYESYYDRLQHFFWTGKFPKALYRYEWYDIEYENRNYNKRLEKLRRYI